MDEPLAVALKFGFLAVLYLFLLWVVAQRAARPVAQRAGRPRPPSPWTPRRSRRDASPAPGPARRRATRASRWSRRWATSRAPPSTWARAPRWAARTTPRSASTTRSPPRRTRGSSPRGDFMYVEDMGSTNGTYLNGRQLRRAERLKDGRRDPDRRHRVPLPGVGVALRIAEQAGPHRRRPPAQRQRGLARAAPAVLRGRRRHGRRPGRRGGLARWRREAFEDAPASRRSSPEEQLTQLAA